MGGKERAQLAQIDSANALKDIANNVNKPWHKKGEYWVGITANILAVTANILAILALLK